MEYNETNNLSEQVQRAQFAGKMTPFIYQNVSDGKTDDNGGYVGFYGHVFPPTSTNPHA